MPMAFFSCCPDSYGQSVFRVCAKRAESHSNTAIKMPLPARALNSGKEKAPHANCAPRLSAGAKVHNEKGPSAHMHSDAGCAAKRSRHKRGHKRKDMPPRK